MNAPNKKLKGKTRKQAASHLGMCVRKLDELRKIGAGPRYFFDGRFVCYSTADLNAWKKDPSKSSTLPEFFRLGDIVYFPCNILPLLLQDEVFDMGQQAIAPSGDGHEGGDGPTGK